MNARLSAVLFGSAAAGVALLALLDAAAKGFVLLAVACVVAFAMRRAPASARHLVWLAALACALVLPVLSWALPQWRALPRWMRWEAVPVTKGTDRTERTERTDVASWKMPAAPVVAPGRPFVPSVLSVPSRWPRTFRISATALFTIWLVGAALLLGPLAWSFFALARVSRRACVVTEGRIAAHVAAIAHEVGLRRRIRILLGDAEAMPMVWGLFRAHLLLPSSAADWPEARLRGVLLHELAHLRRRDPLALLVAQLALALHWFNPLAWFAVRRLRAEQERALAGVGAGPGGFAGVKDDAVLRGDPVRDNPNIVSQISRIVIGTSVAGSPGTGDSFGILAETIVRCRIGAAILPFTPGAHGTGDYFFPSGVTGPGPTGLPRDFAIGEVKQSAIAGPR